MSKHLGEQLLVVGPSWVGDMVMAQSLFKLLKQQDAERAIDVLAPAWSEPLLARMPEVRYSVIMPLEHGELGLARRRSLGRSIRDTGYDRAIILPRSLKSALVPFFARIPVRTGFRGEWRYGFLTDVRRLDKRHLDQTVKRFMALGLKPGDPIPPPPSPELSIDEQNRAGLCKRFELDVERNVVAMMPGAAYGPAKCWPLDYYAELAKRLRAAGNEVWVFGSDRERADGDIVAGEQTGVRNLCGLTRLEDTVDLLSLASVAVTNDSGLMHVAAAAAGHVVAIYGSTSPDFTPPLTKHKTIEYLDIDCSPCFQRQCPLVHLRCLKEISPETVEAAVNAVQAA